MKALILAAGLGTRLRPITDTIPKPLVPIAGKTLLAYHLDHLRQHGVTDILINTHYLPDQIDTFVSEYQKAQPNDFSISTTYEPELLGSAGTLRANRAFFEDENEPFFVVYSDNLTDINYTNLLAAHREQGPVATIASYFEAHPEQKGIIEYDETGLIKRFVEKPKPEQVTSNYANAGIYVVSPEIFPLLEELEESVLDFGHHVFPHLLRQDRPMRVYTMNETLLDIGNHENYTKAQDLPEKMNLNYDNDNN